MLLSELQDAIKARLLTDGWFGDAQRAVGVVCLDPGEPDKSVAASLNRCGCGLEIEMPKLGPGDVREAIVANVLINIGERPLASRARGAAYTRSAEAVGLKALALLMAPEWAPGDCWAPMELVRFEPVGTTADGVVVWELGLRTMCMWDIEASLLGTESGTPTGLCDEQGRALQLSPTPA